MQLAIEQLVKSLVGETIKYRSFVVAVFVVVSLTILTIGFFWPKVYTATTSIVASDRNIIKPLMEGAAVTTEIRDHTAMAKEIIYGRKIMNEVLKAGGWLSEELSAFDWEKLATDVQNHTEVSGKNVIKISYQDNDPVRAFKVTKTFADMFISQSAVAKDEESRSAFEFINKQVEEYHAKLVDAENKLKEFRTENIDAAPGAEGDISARISTLLARIENTTLELKEAMIKRDSIEKQLSGEAEATVSFSREGQYRNRIGELQNELEKLRLTYHDTYPDIASIKGQIEDLKRAILDEKQRREDLRDKKSDDFQVDLDETITANPLYQELRSELAKTNTQVATLESRVKENKRLLDSELDRAKRMHGGEATLAELTRDYQVNRDIYQDLLRRRENARVSMNMDQERQGIIFKIQEPAVIPATPSGLRFIHFAIASLMFGLLVPIGGIYLIQQMDPRVRHEYIISEKIGIPVLAVVPELKTPSELHSLNISMWVISVILLLEFSIYGYVGWLKWTGAY